MPSTILRAEWGHVGRESAQLFTVTNSAGASFQCTTYGATIVSVKAPDRNGVIEEVTLCHNSLEALAAKQSRPYYGCVTGRVANRIANGKFSINDREFLVAVNNGPNHLHGGLEGFDQKMWKAVEVNGPDRVGIEFRYTSSDGEEGYPGTLLVSVLYQLTDMNDIIMSYTAFADRDTVVNLTNHTYWNLSGALKSKIYDHHLQLSCSAFLPVDATQIPTGELRSVEGTCFDFTVERKMVDNLLAADGAGRVGLDHCFVVDDALEERGSGEGWDLVYDATLQLQGAANFLRHVATLCDPVSGRQLIVHATQPGVQVYTANWLSQSAEDHPHTQHNAICLETQHFPDSINQPRFPTTVLRADEGPYHHTAVFSLRIR